jgi:hypothetical protein
MHVGRWTLGLASKLNGSAKGGFVRTQQTPLDPPLITKLGAQINAIHSSAAAASTKSDDAGLEPIVFMAKGAEVMLTDNLW